MKNIFILAALILSLLFATSVSAQETNSPTVTITAPKYTIEQPDHYRKMWPEDFRDYIRDYSLSNGKTLRIFNSGSRMYAEVDNLGRHAIVATAENTFVAPDRQLKMTINLVGDDDANGELLMVVPSQNVAEKMTRAPVQNLAQAKRTKGMLRQKLAHGKQQRQLSDQDVARNVKPEERTLLVAFR